MMGWNDHDDDFDQFSDVFNKEVERGHHEHESLFMKGSTIAYVVLSLTALAFLLCWCCRRRRMRGQVLAPPMTTTTVVIPSQPAPYPQQTYNAPVAYPVASPYPAQTNTGQYPKPQHQYPGAGSPYPAAGAPYPTGGAPYPTSGAPYPPGGAPFPPGDAPYPPGDEPFPTGGAPYPISAAPYPTAGSAYPMPRAEAPGFNVSHHTNPPSYEQAVSHDAYTKQAPYNPSFPHS